MNLQTPLPYQPSELEVRAWYFKRTGKQIRSRSYLAKIAEDYRLLKIIADALGKEDSE